METFLFLYVFFLGALVGSFLNVVALRYNSGMPIVSGRSECFHCSSKLKWYELIPLFSYLFLGGKCRSCKSQISPRYFIVEVLVGLLFVGVVIRHLYYLPVYNSVFENSFPYILFLFLSYIVSFSLLVVIGLYDLKHMIIPDRLVYLFIFIASIKLILFLSYKINDLNIIDIFDALSPFLLSIPFYLLWLMSKGRLIGFGDIKLIFGIGALLGFAIGISAIIFAFWVGALWSVGMIIFDRINKRKFVGMKSEIPFAPFLILGTFIAFFSQIDVFSIEKFISLIVL